VCQVNLNFNTRYWVCLEAFSGGIGGIFGAEVQGGIKNSSTAWNVLSRGEFQKSNFQEHKKTSFLFLQEMGFYFLRDIRHPLGWWTPSFADFDPHTGGG